VTFDLTSPVSGTMREANPALADSPELVNQDPYGAGWLALIELSNWEADRAILLTAEQYLEVMRVMRAQHQSPGTRLLQL